jgi:hypothetical protein
LRINSDTLARFNQAKNFKMTKNFTLTWEFNKYLRHFTNEDLKIFVQHLLEKTPDWTRSYPKVIVHKASKVHPSHYFAAEWVNYRKKMMIVLQKLDKLDCILEFIKANKSAGIEKWRTLKKFTKF